MATGLYIHIPFCVKRCKYCDFCSSLKTADYQRSYINALLSEMAHISRTYPEVDIDSIYVGGGTPSSLYAGGLSEIFEGIRQYFRVDSGAEITIEANPESVRGRLAEFKEVGANRISLGVQSLSDDTLSLIGRAHDSTVAKDAIEATLSTFSNVSVDVMLGLPMESIEGSVSTVERLLDYPITHVSAYSLKLERGTPLYVDRANYSFLSDDDQAKCYEEVVDLLHSRGIGRYEVSNFALEGYESKHNLKYWHRQDYIGLGASAHSHIGEIRYHHTSDIDAYILSPKRRYKRVLSLEDILAEYFMLGFRTTEGVRLSSLRDIGIDVFERYRAPLKKWNKCLNITENSISIKDEYLYCMNQIAVDFI